MILIKQYKINNDGFESIFREIKKKVKKLAKDNEIVGFSLNAKGKKGNLLTVELQENETK